MFVKQTKNREGKIYISVTDSYREGGKVRYRTIKSFGQLAKLEAENPNFLEELKADVKAGKYSQETKEFQLTLDLSAGLDNPLKNYGWLLLDRYLKNLNVLRVFNAHKKTSRSQIDAYKALRLLVSQRVLDPASKLRTIQTQENLFGDFNFETQEVYRALDILANLSEEIQLTMHKAITKKYGRTAALVFYDVTNYYWEADLDDEEVNGEPAFRKRGPSKEKRPNPIVQMGLFMDANGIPIAFKLFPGNCVDVKTYLPALEQIKSQFGIERIVVVADKGMNSADNILETGNNGDGYLFSQKIRGTRGAPKDIQEFVTNDNDWEPNESGTFAKKSFIRTRSLKAKGKQTKTVTEKVVATWRQSYDIREKMRRDKAIEYAEKLTAGERFRMTMKKGGKRYLDVSAVNEETGEIQELNPHITIDEEQIAFDEQFDGINVLITSDTDMTDEEIISAYQSLSRIEDCFRTLKTTFDARPVYLSTRPHIEAHFLVCFIALTVMRVIEHETEHKMSPGRIKDGLRQAMCKELDKGYWEVIGTDDLKELNQHLGIEWDKKYVTIETLRRYGR